VVNYIRHPTENQPNATVVYPSCPGVFNQRQCQKKLEDQGNGEWMCSRCGPIQEPSWRYLVSFSAMDHTGVQWITAFGDQADPLFGFPASHYVQVCVMQAWRYTHTVSVRRC
jgi:replication factor A1